MTAVNPRPRARRAINTDATPLVPEYETRAREAYRANKIKNAAASVEKAAKADTHRLMAANQIGSFEFVEGNKTVDAIIEGGTETEINVQRLYDLVGEGTITLPQFLKTVGATQTSVKKELGENVLAMVSVVKNKEATLSIKERK